jgi:hypothetical protein
LSKDRPTIYGFLPKHITEEIFWKFLIKEWPKSRAWVNFGRFFEKKNILHHWRHLAQSGHTGVFRQLGQQTRKNVTLDYSLE